MKWIRATARNRAARPALAAATVAAALVAVGAAATTAPAKSAAASAAPVPQTQPGDPIDPRTYAPKSRLFLVAYAVGVQKYTCAANGTWQFTDPEAELFRATRPGKEIGSHFLNFTTGRPVWEATDGSAVEAARKASQPVGTADIAWLLLETARTTSGADGDRFTSTTWVQRLNTVGGVAPAGACTPGAQTGVPYTADYFFWKAAGPGK